jgi:hypothetical protein
MSLNFKKIALLCGFLFFLLLLTPNSNAMESERICPEITEVLEINEMIICLHHCFRETILNIEDIVEKYPEANFFGTEICKFSIPQSINKQIQILDKHVNELEKIASSSTLNKGKICLIEKNLLVFIRSVRLYISWCTILDAIRRDVEPDKGNFRISYYRGYSSAFASYQQSLAILLLQVNSQQNFQENNLLINQIAQNVRFLKKQHRRNKFGLSLNYFGGKKNNTSFRYIGFNFHGNISTSKKKWFIIPEVGVDLDGDHHALTSLLFAHAISAKIQISTGFEMVIPKTGNVQNGWHFGVTIKSVRPIAVGLIYSTLFKIGIQLAVFL